MRVRYGKRCRCHGTPHHPQTPHPFATISPIAVMQSTTGTNLPFHPLNLTAFFNTYPLPHPTLHRFLQALSVSPVLEIEAGCRQQVMRPTHIPKDRDETAWRGCSLAWRESCTVIGEVGGISDGVGKVGVSGKVSREGLYEL
jgi:hypothetical protein